ncbi:hypothetical protein EDD16DRAFT_1705154 [Pisolithus croceorrhizus]|nr:hypothetical protein EV401DRAFT_2078334 [Pisolithus croceorrhizus]KAI6122346.1 hypothetical protein EDD16DRAFT_1705154 [Pisolithus croceorrhizus]KAI6142326.1 hypothetical protein EDD17DRAFT_1769228 [Pisolithus thermaeus]
MSTQPSMSQQPAPASSHDWSQAADKDLEVHMSNLEGTERAKEVEKSQWEAAKSEHGAEEARLEWERKEQEEHERQEWERQEQEEHERLEWEEQERWEALAAAWQAAVAEAEAV